MSERVSEMMLKLGWRFVEHAHRLKRTGVCTSVSLTAASSVLSTPQEAGSIRMCS